MIATLLLLALVAAIAYAFVRPAMQDRLPAPDVTAPYREVGVTVLIAHRRANGLDRERFLSSWAASRARLIGGDLARIGAAEYVQVHQIARSRPIYHLVNLSRSWPVSALLYVLHGLPVPKAQSDDLEDWDLVELLDFPDAAAVERFLSAPDLADLRQALADDAATRTARTQVVAMAATEAYRDARAETAKAMTVFFLRAQPALGREKMLRYWLDRHRPFVLSMVRALGFPLYRQLVARDIDALEAAAQDFPGQSGDPWDGVAILSAPSIASLTRDILNVRVQRANFALIADETRFLNLPASSLTLGQLRHRQRPGSATE